MVNIDLKLLNIDKENNKANFSFSNEHILCLKATDSINELIYVIISDEDKDKLHGDYLSEESFDEILGRSKGYFTVDIHTHELLEFSESVLLQMNNQLLMDFYEIDLEVSYLKYYLKENTITVTIKKQLLN